MIRKLAIALLAIALAACSQKSHEPAQPAPSPALWQVADGTGKTVGWLFGTIHALPRDTEWRTPRLDKVIVDAGELIVEVKDLDDTVKLSATFTRMSHTDGLPPLSQRVPERLRGKLQALLAKGGYREADFKAIETWGAALMLAQLADKSTGENGVDKALIRDFRARDVVELEGIEGQFAIFDQLPEKDQEDLLGAVLEDDTMNTEDTAKLERLWLKGDMVAISKEGDTGMLADPDLKKALLTDRNKRWADTIALALDSGKMPLVAVGAAHLAPPAGLPELLRAKGFRVTRVE
ncbi:TraB/GumN family protein [Tsuneonella mangrovi]|uniref:TraB/GumN family protein n=1 Tax=Tsuneonella mangrovi TaxID=1982042 RepID=UPI000BA24F5D|nr:TraB/GumN family protein [Tsuneonella mangrovi]